MFSRVSHAWRAWKSAKAIAILAILALAIGIGSTTAIYTVVDAVLLAPLPYAHSDRLVAMWGMQTNLPRERNGLSYADLQQYQQRVHSFEAFGWFYYTSESSNLMFRGHPENVNVLRATPLLLNNLGVSLARGRWFRDPAHDAGGYHVAVISTPLWHRLGSDPGIVGKSIALDGRQFSISGVAPAGFRFPLAGVSRRAELSDVWIPLDPHDEAETGPQGLYLAYARLRPDVSLASAEAEVKRVAAQIAQRDSVDHPPTYSARLESLRDSAVTDVRPSLLLLFAGAGLLFLITCANVAGLLLARSIARARETAVCVAIGATRSQLAGQFFVEGLFVSLPASALGILVSVALVRLVLAISGEYNPFADRTELNLRVFFFVCAAAVLSSALFSCTPLWQALRTTPNSVLSGGLRASMGKPGRRLSQWLVVSQIALAFTLLGASSLLLTQLSGLYHVAPGFESNHLLTFKLQADPSQYPAGPKLVKYQKRLIETLQGLPGVSGAAFTDQLPLAGCCYATRLYPDGFTVDAGAPPTVNFNGVSANYAQVMRIPLYRGRFLSDGDTNEKILAMVINQTAATRFWSKRNPVGASGYLRAGSTGPKFQVVGVVGDVRNKGLSDPPVPEIYLASNILEINPMTFIVRSPAPESVLLPQIRRAILKLAPTQPIFDVRPMATVIQTSLTLQRLSSLMTALFASIAVLMAALSIYGVMAYSVRQRTVEFGTRMALGAQNRNVFRLVIGDGFRMAGYGVAIGAVTVSAATWLLFHVYKIVDAVEVSSFIYSLLLVGLIVFTACFFPAWRATLLSPMLAIRDESLSAWAAAGRSVRQILNSISTPSQRAGETQAVEYATLLSDFINATRQADTFDEALRLALTTLRERLGASKASLFENVSGAEYACIAAVPAGETPCRSLPAPGFLSSRLHFYGLPLPINAGDLETWMRWALENKPQYVTEIQTLAETQTLVAVPLRMKAEILGLLLLGAKRDGSDYNGFELRLLRNCAEQFALMLENARLTGRVVEQEKLRRDVALAAEVQRRLLPESTPESAVVSFAANSLPARSVGGDYYDFLQVGNHRIGIALADIAGKGIAAALLMSVVQASLRIIAAEENISLPQLAAKMNRYLYRSTGMNGYATFFYAQLDESSRQLRYVNAGHNPPYLLRSVHSNGNSSAEIEELATGGMIIGMFPQAKYEEATVNLQTGDLLIAFTDGVTEALNPAEEEFGEERLKSLLRRFAPLSSSEISCEISRELKSWIANADQYDDLTFVVMKVN